jgi:hypothetical protein
VTVGGITAGTVLTGLTTNQILEEILVPTLNPTLTAPYNSFVKTSPSADLYEIADVQTIAFSATFNRGTISPAYGTSGNRSGLPSIYNYTGTGLPSTHSSSALSDTQSATAYSIIQGNQSWSSTVTYLIGEQPKNSKGGNYSTPLAAGTTGSITRTIEGVYPLFATTVAIATQTKQTLVSMLSANNIVIPMVAQTAGYKQSFEIPNTWLSSRPLVGVQTYNTVSGQWEYQGATASNSLGYWNTTADNQTIQSNSIGYTKYSYNGTDRGAINIRLVF